MLSFVQNWLGGSVNPIGIDFGSDSLRLAQIQFTGHDHHLFAAASCEVPAYAKDDLESRLDFFSEAVRDLLTQGKFKGRRAVLSLPATMMHVRHVRIPKTGDAEFNQTLRREAHAKLPINPAGAQMRHLFAGDVIHHGEVMQEVILIAAAREAVGKYLAVAAKLKLNVVGMNVEPLALVDCFSHVHRRKIDEGVVSCYVDLGATGTRVVIARGSHVLFTRKIELGGNHFNAAIAAATHMNLDDARLLRLKLTTADAVNAGRDRRNVSPLAPTNIDGRAREVEAASHEIAGDLISDLAACLIAHEASFPAHKVQRLIFVGGEANHRSLCEEIARELNLPAQIGDPLVRMAHSSQIPIETGIDRRLPQPGWAVAIGLSFNGPRVHDPVPTIDRSRVSPEQLAASIDDDGVQLDNTDRFFEDAPEPAGANR